MKKFSKFLTEMEDIDRIAQNVRQTNAQNAQNDANFTQRRFLFDQLKRHIPQIAQTDYSTPQAASALYNQLGRSSGVIKLIMANPQLLNKVIVQWVQLAAQGEIPMLR